LRALGEKAWIAVVESCNAAELKLYYLKIRSLAGIEVFMGRRMGMLCPACSAKKFGKLTEDWERMIQTS
jgi:hypothetical protein